MPTGMSIWAASVLMPSFLTLSLTRHSGRVRLAGGKMLSREISHDVAAIGALPKGVHT